LKRTSEISDTKSNIVNIQEEFAMLRQDIRDWTNDMIKIGFLLSVAHVAIVFGFVLLIS